MSFQEATKENETATPITTANTTIAPAQNEGVRPAKPSFKVVRDIEIDRSRDDLLTDFGKKTMEDLSLIHI